MIPRPDSGPGSRGGTVHSLDEAIALHEQHKPDWTERIRRQMAHALLTAGTYHADDLAVLEIPETHANVHGGITISFLAKGFMVEVGRRRVEHAAAHSRKAGVYAIVEEKRGELEEIVGVGGSGVESEASARASELGVQPVDAVPSNVGELTLFGGGRGTSAQTNPEAA